MMMGTGNLTELTEADTAGINALLTGMISELDITHVLTTQVSPHARRCVAEINLARRIMFRAHTDHALPKGYHSGLTPTHSMNPEFPEDHEIQELADMIKDFNLRIQVNNSGIHVFNGNDYITTTDPEKVLERFPFLARDASHAFYVGGELSRARIAWQLGKTYVQDRDLDWGCAVTVPDDEIGNL